MSCHTCTNGQYWDMQQLDWIDWFLRFFQCAVMSNESDSANVVFWVLNNVNVYSDKAPWPGICLQSATSPRSLSYKIRLLGVSCTSIWIHCWQQWACCLWKNHVRFLSQVKLPSLRDTWSVPDVLTCLQTRDLLRVWWKPGTVRDTLLLNTCQNSWFPKPAILTHPNSQSVESPFSLDGSTSIIAAFDLNTASILVGSTRWHFVLAIHMFVGSIPVFPASTFHIFSARCCKKIISNPNKTIVLYLFSVRQFAVLYIEHILSEDQNYSV